MIHEEIDHLLQRGVGREANLVFELAELRLGYGVRVATRCEGHRRGEELCTS